MGNYKTNSIGFELTFKGPDSVEAYDQAAGKVGVCLEDAVDNTIYRSTLPEWQAAFAPKVEALTGVKREVNAEATEAAKKRSKTPDTVKNVMETVPRYVKRAIAGMNDADKAVLAKVAQEVADGISIDPSPSKRAAAIPKEYRDKAESLLTLDDNALEAKITGWGEKYPNIDVTSIERGDDGRPTSNSLAQVVRQVIEAKMTEV